MIQTQNEKIALCAVYFGIEKAENETLSGNILYSIINKGNILSSKGYTLLTIGDFNAHIGEENEGMKGGGDN